MGRHQREALPAEVQEARAKLDAWRTAHKRGTAYPAELWSKAAEWATRFGISPVCRAMGLSYSDLKGRMASTHAVRHCPEPIRPTFVELSLEPGARMQAPGGRGHLVSDMLIGPEVEITSPDGAHMVMRWPSGSPVDAAGLVASFLGRRR